MFLFVDMPRRTVLLLVQPGPLFLGHLPVLERLLAIGLDFSLLLFEPLRFLGRQFPALDALPDSFLLPLLPGDNLAGLNRRHAMKPTSTALAATAVHRTFMWSSWILFRVARIGSRFAFRKGCLALLST